MLLFLIWAFICCKVSGICLCYVSTELLLWFPQSYLPRWKLQIGWDSVMIMSADKRELFLYEAFLYFNPLLLAVSPPPPPTHSLGLPLCGCMDSPLCIDICCMMCLISLLYFRLWWFGCGESTYGFLLKAESIMQKYLILIKIIWPIEKYGRYQLTTLTYVLFGT